MMLQETLIRFYPVFVTALFVCAVFFALAKYICRALGLVPGTRFLKYFLIGPLSKKRSVSVSVRKMILNVLIAFAISRVFVWLIGYLGCLIDGTADFYLNNQLSVWTRWDAPHYLGIAEKGYQTVGDARFHIVFYPLYPYIVRFFTFGIIPIHISAFLVSNICLILSGIFLYLIVAETYGKKYAAASVWFFMFSPATVFFSIPYTESLFFLLTVLSVYFARKRRFGCAILFASLSALTRLPGVVSAVFVFFEMVRKETVRFDKKHLKKYSAGYAKAVLICFLICLLILSGFFAYLIINKAVTGSAFTFLKYQKEHWGQQTGTLYKTAEYTIRYVFYPFMEWYRTGIYLPQSVIIAFVLFVMLMSMRKAHPGDLAYGVVYYYVTIIPTMLLSGTRYLCAMYCLYPMLAVLWKRNVLLKAAVFIVWTVFFIYGTYMYAVKATFL